MYRNHHGCGPWGRRHGGFALNPPVNITESDSGYTLHVYAPDLVKENFSLTTKNDVLSIRYNIQKSDSDQQFTRREYRPEEIDRLFDLKGKVNTSAISASYSNGVLVINLPKTASASRPAQDIPLA